MMFLIKNRVPKEMCFCAVQTGSEQMTAETPTNCVVPGLVGFWGEGGIGSPWSGKGTLRWGKTVEDRENKVIGRWIPESDHLTQLLIFF